MKTVLVTGGAGLIGSHTVDLLLEQGYRVKILDALMQPTHMHGKPPWLAPEAEFIHGTITEKEDWRKALQDCDAVVHLAAIGGFTKDVYSYLHNNTIGTAWLYEAIMQDELPIKKIVTASSIAVYGEGKYECAEHGVQYPDLRNGTQLAAGRWEPECRVCASPLKGLPIDEETPVRPATVYSISKYDQERLTLFHSRALNIPSTALRFFVTYGPRQSVTNPYTGIISIFSKRIEAGEPPLIFEDGQQTRDFVYAGDVARAIVFCLENPTTDHEVFNIGTGRATGILSFAQTLLKLHGSSLQPQSTGQFRLGDARHIVADNSKLTRLGFNYQVTLEEGFERYLSWFHGLKAV
jgi:dTDP-L-rhamnose 4-epimerase